MKLFAITLLSSLALLCHCATKDEILAAEYLEKINIELTKQRNQEVELLWTYSTNLTSLNERKLREVTAESLKITNKISRDIANFNWKSYQSYDLKRQFHMLAKSGYSALSDEDFTEFFKILTAMISLVTRIRVCNYEKKNVCNLSYKFDIEHIFANSRDPKMLQYYWLEFHNKAGIPSRTNCEKYITLNNKAAKLNDFKTAAEMFLAEYEDSTIEKQLENVVEDIKPLYQQIHAYVRHRLRQYYGEGAVSVTGPIPVHLLGNLWGSKWSNIADIVLPFPNKLSLNISEEMVKQGYTPLKMFQMAEDFFTSMGLKKLPQRFWDKSILERPTDGRELDCSPNAWDFYAHDDVRVKQCTNVSQDDFIIAHHELGYVQYFLQYQNQSFSYRNGANPSFPEAVSGVFSLSASTSRYLKRVGLLKKDVGDDQTRLNQLFLKAISQIVFVPFAFTVDKYRWSLFRGQVNETKWNCEFWKLREEYSGIKPPEVRTEKDFDAFANFYISGNIEYSKYALSTILQFQLYKSACVKAAQYDPKNLELPLDNCDIYGSLAAGESFAKMLSLGASKPWPDVLETFNDERTISGKAIVEYFEPLRVWLEEENKKNNATIGWTKSGNCVSA